MENMKISKKLELGKRDYHTLHLEIINPFLPIRLTPREIDVLSAFMSLSDELAEDRFGTTARKVVMKRLGISPGGLGNYLNSLKEKGFVYKEGGALWIASIVLPDPEEQSYQFNIVNTAVVV